MLVLSGCAQQRSADAAGPVPVTTVTPAAPAPAEPAPVPADPADIGVTPSGVPVAIVDRAEDSTVVRSPCGQDVRVASVAPLGDATIVLDPGHGGPEDTGAVGPNGLLESALNLTVARAVQQELAVRGIGAVLTRTGDYPVPLSVRAAFADAAGARVLLSIHHNSPASAASPVPGTEVFVQSDNPESARLGGIVYEETMAALSQFDVAWTRRHDAGVLRVHLPDGSDAYGMIRRPQVPTALVELGYLANPAEAALFARSEYEAAAARSLSDAVEAYLGSDRPGSGFVGTPRTMTPGRSHATDACTDPPLG